MQREQRDDQREIGHGIQVKRRRLAPHADDEARQRRTDQARPVEGRAIHRDGRGDLLLADEFRHERGRRRHLERVGNPEQKRDREQVPDLNLPRRHQPSDEQRERDLNHLRHQQDGPFVTPVRSGTAQH